MGQAVRRRKGRIPVGSIGNCPSQDSLVWATESLGRAKNMTKTV